MEQVIAKPPGLKPFPFFIHEAADKFISRRIRRTGVWEPFESALFLNLLGSGDQVIDVGANIGWYAVSAGRRVAEQGHVFAFEPYTTNFALLSANVRAGELRWVTAEKAALGRGSGAATMQHSADNQGDHRVRSFVAHASAASEPAGEPAANGLPPICAQDIRVVALDDYLAQSPHFDLDKLRVVKIDVQGFENEVLQGASGLLSSLPRRAIIFIEFDPVLLRDNDPAACGKLIDALLSLRREVFAISRPIWRLKRLSATDLQDAASPGLSRCFDLVVAHPESFDELRKALPGIPRILSRAALSAP